MTGFRFIGIFPTGFHMGRSPQLEADRSARLVSIFLKAGKLWRLVMFFFLTKMIFLWEILMFVMYMFFCFLMVFCFKCLFWPWFVFFLRYWLEKWFAFVSFGLNAFWNGIKEHSTAFWCMSSMPTGGIDCVVLASPFATAHMSLRHQLS